MVMTVRFRITQKQGSKTCNINVATSATGMEFSARQRDYITSFGCSIRDTNVEFVSAYSGWTQPILAHEGEGLGSLEAV
ncbi:hypothetical protein TSUD_87610 [Trifolium subterraneum]|uniref:Uncharacterized protein n=1 Tax=Trifolium subterraneum TaxID=3900 RepID=A0A2Z6PNG6_TRISU|nr:hypothetical protein TSUD_87610 [Trifolium subterraneum]